MWITKAAVLVALKLSTGCAQEYSADLSLLDGLSDTEIASKFASDPVLFANFLRAANVRVGSSIRGSASSSSTSSSFEDASYQESSSPFDEPFESLACPSAACPTATSMNFTSVPFIKYPLPKGAEFLGIGYNVLTGNPRGSLSSELDPGFGFPVLALTKSTKKIRGFGYPDVSYIKGSKSCTFSSKAKDISSSRDYQESLSKESSSDTSITVGFDVKHKGVEAAFDSKTSFSKSEKMTQFQQEQESMNTVSYESLAKCIELQMEINPYMPTTLDDTFTGAMGALPKSYNGTDIVKAQFSKFIQTYGTHYITKLDMGGKMVANNEMSASDAMSLTRSKVDIASTLSFDFSFSLGKDKKEKDPKAKKETGKVCCNNTMQSPADEEKKDKSKDGKSPFGFNVGVKNNNSKKESRSKEDKETVKSSITKSSVYTVGGLPPTDEKWQTWAATVADNPMPVSYKYAPLWTLPQFENYTDAFLNAVEDIYGVNLVGNSVYDEDMLRYGVAAASGKSISRYSLNPDRTRRAYLELLLLPSSEVQTETVEIFHKKEKTGPTTSWTKFVGAAQDDSYACGLRAYFQERGALQASGGGGISGLDVRFCSIHDWYDQEQHLVHKSHQGNQREWVMCNTRHYIAQIAVYVEDNDDVNALDIESLHIGCRDLDGNKVDTNSKDNLLNIVPGEVWGEDRGPFPENPIPGKVIKSIRVEHGGGNDLIRGLEVRITSAEANGGPINPLFYYETFWDLELTKISALFATPIRGKIMENAHESNQLSFTTSQGLLTIESASHYTYMQDPTRPKIAITNFKGDVVEEDLPSLSFLVTDAGLLGDGGSVVTNRSLSGDMIAGVVHPDGYGISSRSTGSDVRFRVVVEDKDKPNLVTVVLKGISRNHTHVMMLISPLWFPNTASRFPVNAGDVSTASVPCEKILGEWRCSVHVGTEDNMAARNHLGFSFLAVGDKVSPDFALHGSVLVKDYEVNTASDVYYKSEGVEVTPDFNDGGDFSFYAGKGDMRKINIKNHRTGGVLLKFDPPFEDIPSLIVSPQLSKQDTLSRISTDVVRLPHVVVEHLTEEGALIRVGLLDTFSVGVSSTTNSCSSSPSSPNVKETFIPKFNKPGVIRIRDDLCFEVQDDGSSIYARPWNYNKKSAQEWVYDGTRIRRASDPTKCIMGKGANQMIRLHTCGSDEDSIDDERFTFVEGSNGDISLFSQYNRCLYKDGSGEGVLLTGNPPTTSDSRCKDGSDPNFVITVAEDLPTAGFKLLTADSDVTPLTRSAFTKCFSGSTTSKKIDPLGNCDSSSWLLGLDPNDNDDNSFKLKFVADNKDTDMWLVFKGNEYSLDNDNGSSKPATFDIGNDFYGTKLSANLSDYRLKVSDKPDVCLCWDDSLKGSGELDYEGSIYEPIGFNFIAIAPTRESNTTKIGSLVQDEHEYDVA